MRNLIHRGISIRAAFARTKRKAGFVIRPSCFFFELESRHLGKLFCRFRILPSASGRSGIASCVLRRSLGTLRTRPLNTGCSHWHGRGSRHYRIRISRRYRGPRHWTRDIHRIRIWNINNYGFRWWWQRLVDSRRRRVVLNQELSVAPGEYQNCE